MSKATSKQASKATSKQNSKAAGKMKASASNKPGKAGGGKASASAAPKGKAAKPKPSKPTAKPNPSAIVKNAKTKAIAGKAVKKADAETKLNSPKLNPNALGKSSGKPNSKPVSGKISGKTGLVDSGSTGKKLSASVVPGKKVELKKTEAVTTKSAKADKSGKDQSKMPASSAAKPAPELKPQPPPGQSLEEMLAEAESAEELVITDADGRRFCRIRDCDQLAQSDAYCRFHYIQLWKHIQSRRVILSEGKLERYIEELTARYPDKFLEILRKDLRVEKDFLAAIAELEIDESAVEAEFEEDENQSDLYEVQRMSDAGTERTEDDSF
jgi:hypothetical protein